MRIINSYSHKMEEKNKVFLTDTHTHLASSRFKDDLEEVILRARENGVERIISISCDMEDSDFNAALAEKNSGVFATIGIHPSYVHEIEGGIEGHEWSEKLRTLVSHPEVCAIGEIGLDYFHPPGDGGSEADWRIKQRIVFEKQLQIALEADLPVVVHQRESAADTMDVLRNFPGIRAVLHCFGGTNDEAEEALSLGHYISFTGILTFSKAESVREVARSIPLDRVMVETDCPYLAPVPFRGKRCEPYMVKYTATELGRLHDLGLEEISEITTRNASRFFNLPA